MNRDLWFIAAFPLIIVFVALVMVYQLCETIWAVIARRPLE